MRSSFTWINPGKHARPSLIWVGVSYSPGSEPSPVSWRAVGLLTCSGRLPISEPGWSCSYKNCSYGEGDPRASLQESKAITLETVGG